MNGFKFIASAQRYFRRLTELISLMMMTSRQVRKIGDLTISLTLGRSTAKGFFWLMLQSLSGRAATFVSQIILAKLLLPEAFGQIGLAYTVTGLVSVFVGFGVDDILLQRLRALHLWVTPAFWSSLGLALIGAILMLMAAPAAARIYGNPGLIGLITVLAVSVPLSALSTVPTVKLRIALDFRFVAAYTASETIAVQIASIILAFAGFGAFSFVAPLPVVAAVKAIVFWRKAPARIRLRSRRWQFIYIFRSGLILLATRIIIETINQGDYVVLGLMATATSVGTYFFAFRLAAQPLRMLAGNFGTVLFPALTQLRSDPARQMRAALQASRILAYTVTPICFLQSALAGPVLHLMFGARWNSAIPLVQILSLGLPGDAIAWIAGALLVARREFWRDFFYLSLFAPPFFVSVLFGAHFGSSLGVAIAVSLYYAVIKPMNSWLVFRAAMRLEDFLHIYIGPPLMAGLAIGAAYESSKLLVNSDNLIGQIFTRAAVGLLIYSAMLYLLVPKILREVFDRFPLGNLLCKIKIRLKRS